MTLGELIKKDEVATISQLTNISIENLNYLNEEEFSKLSRVKALGFIHILEREYTLDLDDLTVKVKEYFDENHLEAGNEVVVLSKSSRDNSGFGFFNWLLIFGLLYALWYFYNNSMFDKSLKESSNKEVSLTDAEALKSNVSDEEAKKVLVNGKSSQESTLESRMKSELKKDDSSKETSAPKVPNAEVDLNNTQVMPVTKIVKLEEVEIEIEVPKVVAPVVEEVTETALATEEEHKAELIYNLTINPTRGMLWYGFINIDTKERREFMNKVSTPFELNGGRWILVTGHGFVDIVSDLKTLEISDRKKHHFYIDSTEIKEISKREFREMNGRRGW
ncbi:MAG: hypothetical protein KAG56_03160 [Sulfurovaceae bacterium]|nr:hypothetical protein [Sulfurovaceae bacterium]